MNFYTAMKMNKLLLIYQNIPKLPECEIKQKKPDTKESYCIIPLIVVVQSQSHTWLFAAPWAVAHQSPLSSTISQSLLKFMSTELVMISNHLILCCPLLLCLQSSPASRSFPVNLSFVSGGQTIGASVSATVLPMNIQGWFPLELTGFISLRSKGLSRIFSSLKALLQFESINSLPFILLYGPTLTSVHDYWKNHSFHYTDFCQ